MVRSAIIHSLKKIAEKSDYNRSYAMRDVNVVEYKNPNNVVVLYEGRKYSAIDNPFTGYLYVDDVYGLIREGEIS